MEETTQPTTSAEHSPEKIKEKQKKLIDLATLGTYWKQTWHNPEKNATRIQDFYHIKRLEQHGEFASLAGERIQFDETCLYSIDERATLYDFSFDKSRGEYYAEEITQEEYEALRNKAISVYKNKLEELNNRSALFDRFKDEVSKSLSYTEVMEMAKSIHEVVSDQIEECEMALKRAEEAEHKEGIEKIKNLIEKIKRENYLRVFSWDNLKTEWPDRRVGFNIHTIDTSSLNFKPKSYNDSGVGYVNGSPFEENGENFWYKIKVSSLSLMAENYNRHFYETELHIYFDDGDKNWRWAEESPEGWREYIATKDKYTNGQYRNSPVWPFDKDQKFYLIDDWHYEQLLDLIRFTGLESK
jgi:hypothetical protein